MRFTASKKLTVLMLSLGVLGFVFVARTGNASAAACTAPSTDFGTVTSTVSIPTTGNYRAWSRIQIPNSTSNNFLLEIDGANCFTVGANASLATNTWTWVDYQAGGSKITPNLTAGAHTIKMIGTSEGVLLDRIIFTQDTTCVPSGTGDNCANPPDTTAPNISVTAPAAGATVSGTTTITANASDTESGITKVEFYIDGVLKSTDQSSPYTYSWDTTTVSDGAHSVVAKAYDGANNVGTSSANFVGVSNGKPDLVVTAVSTPTAAKVNDDITFTATIKNQGTAASTPGTTSFKVDGTTIGTVVDTTSLAVGASRTHTLTTTWKAIGGSHTIAATADSTGAITESNESNNALSSSFTVSVPDTIPPTVSISAPAANATVSGATVAISANAADTGGSNLSRVEFYIDSVLAGTDSNGTPFSYTWDSTKVGDGSHTIFARAYDGVGLNTQSTTVTVTVKNATTTPKPGDANDDGAVNASDLSIVLSNWGKSGATRRTGDVNGDGVVNASDLSMILTNWNK